MNCLFKAEHHTAAFIHPAIVVLVHSPIARICSEGQRRKVWALMYRLQDASPSKAPLGDRLCAIIKKELGMDAFPKDPFAWISYKDGNKLVEVLKGYVKTAQKSRGDADG